MFGSRATGRARRYSDLDLAIDTGRPLTLDEIACLTEAFRESDLPYRVDLVDWQTIDDHFREAIASERTLLHPAAHGGAATYLGDPAMAVIGESLTPRRVRH